MAEGLVCRPINAAVIPDYHVADPRIGEYDVF